MDAFATITHNTRGFHLRLTNCGFTFASTVLAVQRGEEPTDSADRTLAEYGFTAAEPWMADIGRPGWSAGLTINRQPGVED